MILTLEDDGCIHVYPGTEAVVLAVEGLDADSCLRQVFDDEAVPYRIAWIEPNVASGPVLRNGSYRLVPAGPPEPAGLLAMIVAADAVMPVEAEPLVAALQEKLRASSPTRSGGARPGGGAPG